MKRYFYVFTALFITFKVSGQDYDALFYSSSLELDVPSGLATQVHSLDDFIQRFNGMHNAYGKPVNKKSENYLKIRNSRMNWKHYRSMIIKSLMDDSMLKDSIRLERFIDEVSTSFELDFNAHNWYIILPFHAKSDSVHWDGKLQMRIHTECEKYRWVIMNATFSTNMVNAECLETLPAYDENIFIPPSAHDNAFISLSKVLRNKGELAHHIIEKRDELNKFAFLMKDQDVEIDASSMHFYFEYGDSRHFVTNANFKIIRFQL